jgi:hypothetical protein
MRIDRDKVVFIRVGWMEFYGFKDDGTIPVGGGSHNETEEGGEISNFCFDNDGQALGYVQFVRGARSAA